jgi:hypothetical protein
MKAAQRAIDEDVRGCQLQGTGQWVATSGTHPGIAYEVAVTGNVAHDCDCLAGLNGDPVCKHRAAFYLLIGALDRLRGRSPRHRPRNAPTATLAARAAIRSWAGSDSTSRRVRPATAPASLRRVACGTAHTITTPPTTAATDLIN